MAFGPSVARGKAAGHNVRRKLFLRGTASGELAKLRIYEGSDFKGELERNWNLELTPRTEQAEGKTIRYFRLFIDDIDGELLPTLKAMTKVRINSVEYKFLSKPSFLSAVPSYTFRVQPMTEV
jgi:hypothetical protein